MFSIRTMALVAIAAALVVVAPAVGGSNGPSADPARIEGGDAPALFPSLVNTRLVRAQSALSRATTDLDESQPAQAVVPMGAAVSNLTTGWSAAKYVIQTTPPPPPEDGTGGGAGAYAGPEDTAFAVLSAQHDVVTTAVGMVETSNDALSNSLLSSIQSMQALRENAVRYIHEIAPPPPPEDRIQPSGQEGGGWATVMPALVPILADEIQMIQGRQAMNQFPPPVQQALTNARLQALELKDLVNQWWPPVPGD
jgi:hypothetical protein